VSLRSSRIPLCSHVRNTIRKQLPLSVLAVVSLCGVAFGSASICVRKQLANSDLTRGQDFGRVVSRHREDGPRATTGEPRNDKERI